MEKNTILSSSHRVRFFEIFQGVETIKKFSNLKLKYYSTLGSAAWVGIGLSDDTRMGGDSVIECVKEGNAVNAYTSFTTSGTGNYGANRTRAVWNFFSIAPP